MAEHDPPDVADGGDAAAVARLAAAGIEARRRGRLAARGRHRPHPRRAGARPRPRARGRRAARLEGWLAGASAREPLQLVLGVAPFYGLEVQVRPGVLVPRPETERLVERALDALRDVVAPRVHDVGTGSGAIALAIAAARPDARVTASDVDPTAVMVARANATALGLDVTVWTSDLLAAPDRAAGGRRGARPRRQPPLPARGRPRRLPPEVAFDPPEALFGGEDGLAVARRWRREAVALLRPGAMVWFELDPRNAERFAEELEATTAGANCASRPTSTVAGATCWRVADGAPGRPRAVGSRVARALGAPARARSGRARAAAAPRERRAAGGGPAATGAPGGTSPTNDQQQPRRRR
jgi:release factor glutamine methyltransferase